MTPARLDALSRLVGPDGWRQVDGEGQVQFLVSPADARQCAAVLRWCHETRTPLGIAASGADAADATPQLVLRTDRLRRLRTVAVAERRLVAEVGAPLSLLAAAAAEHGLSLPTGLRPFDHRCLGLALQAATWGRAVLGLEVVLPDGRVWQGAADAQDSATRFALGSLFFAGGGALGVVTAVNLRLQTATTQAADEVVADAPCLTTPDDGATPLDGRALDAELLARIKRAFDPNHLLNPGQLL